MKKSTLTNNTRQVLTRVLLGRGSSLDKIDILTNLVTEKIAMTEVMSRRITEGSFTSSQAILQHLLSLDRVLETIAVARTTGDDTPTDCVLTDGDCTGIN